MICDRCGEELDLKFEGAATPVYKLEAREYSDGFEADGVMFKKWAFCADCWEHLEAILNS